MSRCPNCDSSDIYRDKPGHLKCWDCDSEWQAARTVRGAAMTPEEMRSAASTAKKAAGLSENPDASEHFLIQGAVWEAAAEICERLDRLAEPNGRPHRYSIFDNPLQAGRAPRSEEGSPE